MKIHLLLNCTSLEETHIPSTHISSVRTSHLRAGSAENAIPGWAATIQLYTMEEGVQAITTTYHLRIKVLNLKDELTQGRAICT